MLYKPKLKTAKIKTRKLCYRKDVRAMRPLFHNF